MKSISILMLLFIFNYFLFGEVIFEFKTGNDKKYSITRLNKNEDDGLYKSIGYFEKGQRVKEEHFYKGNKKYLIKATAFYENGNTKMILSEYEKKHPQKLLESVQTFNENGSELNQYFAPGALEGVTRIITLSKLDNTIIIKKVIYSESNKKIDYTILYYENNKIIKSESIYKDNLECIKSEIKLYENYEENKIYKRELYYNENDTQKRDKQIDNIKGNNTTIEIFFRNDSNKFKKIWQELENNISIKGEIYFNIEQPGGYIKIESFFKNGVISKNVYYDANGKVIKEENK